MWRSRWNLLLLVFLLLTASISVQAQDYVRLRNGQVIKCSILRQDTSVVYTTEWDLRHLAQPPLQVYERREVESIWFIAPQSVEKTKAPYIPHANGWEIGGSFSLQTWAETNLARRHLMVLTAHGGFDITRQFGLEGDLDLTVPIRTLPFVGKSAKSWLEMDVGHQIGINGVYHPIVWKGIVPFLLAGGGISEGVPMGNVILTDHNFLRSMIDVGIGAKWGSGGLGYRIEWRHHIYTWQPDLVNAETGLREPENSANASLIKATLFFYR
jgi:hypothetical protein